MIGVVVDEESLEVCSVSAMVDRSLLKKLRGMKATGIERWKRGLLYSDKGRFGLLALIP